MGIDSYATIFYGARIAEREEQPWFDQNSEEEEMTDWWLSVNGYVEKSGEGYESHRDAYLEMYPGPPYEIEYGHALSNEVFLSVPTTCTDYQSGGNLIESDMLIDSDVRDRFLNFIEKHGVDCGEPGWHVIVGIG